MLVFIICFALFNCRDLWYVFAFAPQGHRRRHNTIETVHKRDILQCVE